MAKVRGKAMWTYTNILDTKYEPCWKITVFMDAKEAKNMVELGLKPKRVDEIMAPELAELGAYQMVIKRNEMRKGKGAGTKNSAPIVEDAEGDPFEEIVGNGSEVVVTFRPFEWNNKFGRGISTDLEKIKVIDHVEYKPETVNEEGGDNKEEESKDSKEDY